jgi:hypothetical protein
MAINIQVEQELNATAQFVKDEKGKTSSLALSTDAVGIGTTSPLAISAFTNLDVKGGARFYSELSNGEPE